jgi:probable addiction module antidote protein
LLGNCRFGNLDLRAIVRRYIAAALGAVARAGPREAGITREALYRALSEDGDPRLSTLLGVAKALGLTLSFNTSSRA